MKSIPYNKEGTYITTHSFLDSVGLEDFEPTYPNVRVVGSPKYDHYDTGKYEGDDLDGNWALVAQSCNDTRIFWTWKFCLTQ